MTDSSNIFSNPPSLTSDEALDKLRQKLNPREAYYCVSHLLDLVNSNPQRDFSVGSIKRYMLYQHCTVCMLNAQFVVNG